jgi:hypothetical protein
MGRLRKWEREILGIMTGGLPCLPSACATIAACDVWLLTIMEVTPDVYALGLFAAYVASSPCLLTSRRGKEKWGSGLALSHSFSRTVLLGKPQARFADRSLKVIYIEEKRNYVVLSVYPWKRAHWRPDHEGPL